MRHWAIAIILAPMALFSQSVQLSGLIRDSSGAALPDAAITLTKEDTGIRYVSRSSADGYYFIPATQPGVYKIRVRKDGFQAAVQLGVRLDAGPGARIDFTLPLGMLQESVEVTAERNPVDTEDAAVGTVIGRGLIDTLPFNGRGLLALLETVPGVTITRAGGGESGQFSAAGQRADSNYVTLDGVSVNNGIGVIGLIGGHGVQMGGVVPVYTALGTTQSLVSLDSIEEFQVQTSGSLAELGRTLGAHLAIITRSGTNSFHGSLADYTRNEAMDANDWFAGRVGQKRTRFRMHDLDATLGGPIVRNRTFFFVSQESLRLDHPAIETQFVPTAISRLSAPAGAGWLLEALPLPNGPEVGGGLGILTLPAPRSSNIDSTSVRLDHAFGPSLQFFSRFSHAPSADALANPGNLFATRVSVSSNSFTAGLNATFGSSLNHSLRLNWTRVREMSATWPEAFGHAIDLSQYLPSLAAPSQTVYTLQILSPAIALVTDNAIGVQRQWNLVDTTTLTRNSHTFAFGVDYRELAPGLSSRPYMMAAVYPNLNAFAAGNAMAISVSLRNSVSLHMSNLSAFAQDTWRISPRLVLNYGLRWEFNPAPGGGAGAPLFESVVPGPPPAIQIGQQGQSLWRRGWGNLAPRLGMAWRLDPAGKSSLRSSIGVFYDPGFAAALQAAISRISTNISLINTVNGVNFIYSEFSTANPASASTLVSNFRMPVSLQWNTTLDRRLADRSVASVSYVGSIDRRLLRLEQTETAAGDPLAFHTNHGASGYHALEAQLHSRLQQGLEGLISFTCAHSIDNVSRDGDLFQWEPGWPGAVDRGNSSFDIRRSFSTALTYSPRMLRGWSFNAIFHARSGFPLTVTALNPLLPFGLESRANLVAARPVWIADLNAPDGRRLNPAAFSAPKSAGQGSLGRNAIEGFGMSQLDISIQKEFRLHDRLGAQLRLEAFNAFNHPNYGNPDTFLSDPTFGRAVSMLNQFLGTGGPSSGLAPAFQIGGPRSLQAALRLHF